MAATATIFELKVKLGAAEFAATGAPELVENAFGEFKTLLDSMPIAKLATTSAPAPALASSSSAPGGEAAGGDKVPFAVFMRRSWPNQGAKAAAIYTWVLRYEGRDRLKPGEMADLWKRIDKRPGNPTMVCQRAEKEGWLEALGGGFYAVTGHGESMVDGTAEIS